MKKILLALVLLTSQLLHAQTSDRPWLDHTKPIDERVKLLISAMTTEEKVSQMLDKSPAIERLGIDAYFWWNEALHGVARSAKATIFPQSIGLAATFDNDLMFDIGTAISDEARAINNGLRKANLPNRQYMGLTFWSPNVNIFRDPRWGRGQETYGEDPFLTGNLGASFIKGMQGDNEQYLKTAACAKHFAVHNGPEAERHGFNAKTSQRDLYETYLPAFKACIDADVEAVMCAYNRTNDEPCCGSTPLLKNILRDDWGFDGHIVSDCGAVKDIYTGHHYTATAVEASALALKNGVNLNCGKNYLNLTEALEKGLVTEQQLNESLAVLLKTRFKLGLFDPESLNPYNSINTDVINSKKHKDLTLEAARKSVVLLKNNDNTLPLADDISSIYISGPLAGEINSLIGNYNGMSPNMVTVAEGIIDAVSSTTNIRYRNGALLSAKASNPLDWYSGISGSTDATIAVVGTSVLLEGEEGEATANAERGDNLDMKLPESQMVYLRKIGAKAKKLIVVVCAGSPIDLTEIEELADAIIYAWYPGEQGGNAIADIIFGKVSPSGKLPMTFPKSAEQLPDFNDYAMEGRTYKFMKEEPMYPFGYGLTYADINISAVEFSKSSLKKGKTVDVTVNVTNTGTQDIEEVIQLYTSLHGAKDRTPMAELRDYKRIGLKPGESKKVAFTLDDQDLSYINSEGKTVRHKGKSTIHIGNASPGSRSIELGAAISARGLLVK